MDDKYVEIDGRSNLLRDMDSHGVVNSDQSALELARSRKNAVLALQNRVEYLEEMLKKVLERLPE